MITKDREFYGIYADPLEKTQQDLLQEIHIILNKLTTDPEQAPAEHIRSRIKSSDSIREKLTLHGLEATPLNGLTELSDAIGLRIVTHFVGDVYLILIEIENHENWQIMTVKDYISTPKPNGYRSLHVIVQIPFCFGELEHLNIEIQLRTIAMDCWASLEHQLKYKKNIRDTRLIVDELKRCSDEMASTDLTMQTIRDMIRSN